MRVAGDDRGIKSASLGAAGTLDGKRDKSEVADEIPTATAGSPWKGSEILRLKKEAFAANDLWNRYSNIPGGMKLWLKAKADASKVEDLLPKKKKKIVKSRMHPKSIYTLRTYSPHTVSDISDERLAQKSESIREMHIIGRYKDGKWRDYINALVRQYDLLGYAEDEDEIDEG